MFVYTIKGRKISTVSSRILFHYLFALKVIKEMSVYSHFNWLELKLFAQASLSMLDPQDRRFEVGMRCGFKLQ